MGVLMKIVSVIVPSFEPDTYVWDCLDSLCAQSLDSTKYEIIIVLNGRKMPYFEALNNYARNQKVSIRVFYNKIQGVSQARNLGIEKARGKYIAFIDDDDWVSECYLSQLLECADEASIVVSNVIAKDETGIERADYISEAFRRLSRTEYSLLTHRAFLSSSCCKIIPVKMIDNHRFNSKITLGEDSLFMFTIFKKTHRIILANERAIYYRRVRKESASRQPALKKVIAQRSLLLIAYLRAYFFAPFRYSFLLLLTRVMATIGHIFRGLLKWII